MTLTRFVQDRDGVVHELFPYSHNDVEINWSWPTGHVDAYMHVVTPAPPGAVPTCFNCIREREKMPAHVRLKMERLLDKFMR